MAEGIEAANRGRETREEGWDGAALRALVVVVLSLVVFVIIPDRAVTYLSKHVLPWARDLIVVAWVTVAFLFMCWVFVRLQGRREG